MCTNISSVSVRRFFVDGILFLDEREEVSAKAGSDGVVNREMLAIIHHDRSVACGQWNVSVLTSWPVEQADVMSPTGQTDAVAQHAAGGSAATWQCERGGGQYVKASEEDGAGRPSG
jgi:hypothetical protein